MSEQDVCRRALDDACVVSWVVADLTTYEGAKKAINDLCMFEAQLATDPATNGGRVYAAPAQRWRPLVDLPDRGVVLYCDEHGNRWVDTSDYSLENSCGFPPVAWMPLPAPPNYGV